ncbi:hypothetical protein [Aquibacillus salsiterrae]|uniref:Uncharacterized protein n=1 Tax=Aquibacillus salsiterrae TaxID=2950439 RepID=A0A9X4AFP2_9BACI|nr:hypothetical protein [Aquibacillus salsiterrae]MDC3418121.1 hypothetical protein [Aquibacillus salsiterrae]
MQERFRQVAVILNRVVQPGDILYSSKGWSTFLVGHVGIVGEDLRIYHSHPRGAFADSLPSYISRHKFGGALTLLRPKQGGLAAAVWARENIKMVEKYIFHPALDNIGANYCSKFIWQAFFATDVGDITGWRLANTQKHWIFPFQVKNSSSLEPILLVSIEQKSS